MTSLEELVRLYNEGNSFKTIQKLTGHPPTSTRRLFKEHGIKSRSTKTDDELEAKLIQEYTNDNVSSEFLAKKYQIDPCTVCRILKRNGVEIKGAEHFNRQYECDSDLFKEIDSQEKAYFLGFMFADGNVKKTKSSMKIELSKKDRDIIDKFNNMIYNGKFNLIEDEKYIRIDFYNVKMTADIIRHGCVPDKTFKLSFPKTVPTHLVRHFIRGLNDGDGCISFTNERVRTIITGYKPFLIEIGDFIKQELKIASNIRDITKCKSKDVGEISFTRHRDVLIFLDWLYKDSTIHLDRKYEIYKQAKEFLEQKPWFVK